MPININTNISPKDLAVIMAEEPRIASFVLDEMEKQRKRETLRRLSDMIDLSQPSFKGIKALMTADLITPEQAFRMSTVLRQYQANIYNMIYQMNKTLFDMKSQKLRNQLDKMRTEAYIKSQQALQQGNEQDALFKGITFVRKSIDTYLKPYEDNIARQYETINTEIMRDIQLEGIATRDIMSRVREKLAGVKDEKERARLTADLLLQDSSKELKEKYYPKLAALAHMENIINRAKVEAYEAGDKLYQKIGADAIYKIPEIIAQSFTSGVETANAVGAAINRQLSVDSNNKGHIDNADRFGKEFAIKVFGADLGRIIANAMEGDKKVYGDSPVSLAPVDVNDAVKKVDEEYEQESKNYFDLIKNTAKGAAPVAGLVGMHYTYKWWKNRKGDTPFEKKVKEEAAKAAGINPKEAEKVKDLTKDLEKGVKKAETMTKTAEKKAFKTSILEAAEKGNYRKLIGKMGKFGTGALAILSIMDELANPEELNAEEIGALKKALNKGGK